MTTDEEKQFLRKHKPLFWDVDVETIDVEQHATYIIERIVEYGTMESVRWLRTHFGDERLREFFRYRGFKTLSNKTLNYWTILLRLENDPCLQPSLRAASRKYWNY